ncbi:hypothetical protein H6G27_36905 [Nostoc linckia FACHB-104]|nr:hypothetical protein [Nostoc linckia FACHB-104]
MTIEAWTFLISRNQQIDYKIVVAPDFISQAKIRSLLSKISADDFIESERISIRSIQGSEVGNFTVVFRSTKARSNDIGKNGNEILKDSHSREIDFIEGLIFRGTRDEILKKIKIRKTHFNQAHRELIDKYRDFWYNNILSESHAIYLTEDESSPTIHLHKLEPFIIPPKDQLADANQHRMTAGKQSTKNRANHNKLLLILVCAIVILMIWNIIVWILRSPPRAICKSTITIETKTIKNNQEGTTYLKELQKKYLNQKSKDKAPQIWINLASKNTENIHKSTLTQKSIPEKTEPTNSTLTQKSTPEKPEPTNSTLTQKSTPEKTEPTNSTLTQKSTPEKTEPTNSTLTQKSTPEKPEPTNSTPTQKSTPEKTEPTNSTLTQKSTPEKPEQQTKDGSNLTTRLYVDRDYDLLDEASTKLTNQTIINSSEMTAIIVEPEQSKPPCLFNHIPDNQATK